MKKIILGLVAIALVVSASAKTQPQQQASKDDASQIAIMAITPTSADGIPAGAEQALKNKMNQIASSAGLGSMNEFSQFCMLVSVDVETKDVVAGSPPKFAETLNFNFHIVDQFNQTVFATTSVRAKAVGDSETRAYVAAVRALNTRSSELSSFVASGKQKIVDYYNANCDKIIAKSKTLANQQQFGEALFYLEQIPDVCTDCYAKALTASDEIFQQYIDYMCNANLAKAKSIWAATQSSEGGLAAAEYLSEIYPDAACYLEAQTLYNEINSKIEGYITFEMKKWDDLVSLASQRIEASRQVGVAWGTNQRAITYSPAWIH